LPLGPEIVAMLADELVRQESYQRILQGQVDGVHGLRSLVSGECCVFPLDPSTAEGMSLPICPANMRNRFSVAAKNAGLETHPHALRHTHLSHAINGGISLADVAKRAGHSSVLTTANTYVHSVSDSQHKAAAIGDDLLGLDKEHLSNALPILK